MSFDGFPKATISFLTGLSKNNKKPWFDSHRDEYEENYLGAGIAFAEAIAPKLKRIDSKIHADKTCVMRIYRDTRFAKDKKPYKDHLDMWFWSGAKKGWDASGFYFRLTPKLLTIGTGMHGFMPPVLAKYRKAVLDDKKGKKLAEIVKQLSKKGYKIGGESYKKVPRGVDEDHPRASLLKHSGLYTGWEGKHPKDLFTKKAVDFVVGHYEATAPLHEWIKASL
jgi:uncharacterized protein (TIGR02453 family)